ncbi:MAG: mandelate racemase/muconate lactonizing enzyme family protein [Promethearchaeota archaeon]
MNSKIKSIKLTPIHVPFKPAVKKAMAESEGGLGMAIGAEEAWLGGDFVICQIFDNQGNMGVGEVFLWLPETGISPEQVISSIKSGLYKYLIGESPFNIKKINYRMEINLARNEVAKGLLDMACYDLMGQVTNLSVCELMGGRCVEEIPLAALIPLGSPILMKGLVRSYYKKGYRTFRLKLGKGIQEDVEIVSMIRKTFAHEIRLRVDYNQAYAPEQAIQAINAIEPFQIDYAEQPVRIDDYIGMARVQKNVKIPLLSHEGCFSLQDFITLVEMGAVKVLGINSERPGGVTKALDALTYARIRGLGIVLHNQPLGISSAFQIHLHASHYYSIEHATELFGQEMLEDDLIVKPLEIINGKARLPEGPGWGIQLDESALKKYAVASPVYLE